MCKFYQGPEDRLLRNRLDAVFERVVQDKPLASRQVCLPSPRLLFLPLGSSLLFYVCVHTEGSVQESRENYFVALRRRARVDKAEIMKMPWIDEAVE